MPPRRTLVVGANEQLGRALAELWAGREDVDLVGRGQLDLADPGTVAGFDFSPYGTIVNAAAYTAVDAAETADGSARAWAVNVDGTTHLVEAARTHRAHLVHVSSDYVLDGNSEVHTEEGPLTPLGVYGQTKAAADRIVATFTTRPSQRPPTRHLRASNKPGAIQEWEASRPAGARRPRRTELHC